MIDERLWQAIAAGLPAYFDRQRWYADKLRPIASLHVVDVATAESSNCTILLALIGIDYQIGDARRYFVPMTVHRDPTPELATIAHSEEHNQPFWVQDAISDGSFRDFLVDAGANLSLAGQHGTFIFEPWMLDGLPLLLDPDTTSAAAAFEQSNSSITYGDQVIVKLYRRLEVGQNIEVDMNRYLGADVGFPSIPKLISAATYLGEAGSIPLMLVQQHVGEHRDAWAALTDLLRLRTSDSLQMVERLGRVTGEMHVALAAAPMSSALAPQPIEQQDIDAWRDAFLRSAKETDWMTGERLDVLPARSQYSANEYLASPRNWQERSNWFALLEGCYKTRVHGDYHLGQVLVTKDGRLLVVDFEGEPHRPAYEREAKYSPLRDVAGMLRSLNYATGVVANSLDERVDAELRAWLEAWERDARAGFVSAYRDAIEASPVPIAPVDDDAFAKAVTVLETEKALYEIRYEISSRPDWAWLPFDSLT